MSDFEEAIPVLIKDEGSGYVADDDGRGPSKFGVTLKTAKAIHPDWTADTIRDLTKEQAIDFYRDWLWVDHHICLIEDQSVATKILDIAANTGPETCIEILQNSVNALPIDGILGPKTAGIVNALPSDKVLQMFKLAGRIYYDKVIANHPQWANNRNGWINRLDS